MSGCQGCSFKGVSTAVEGSFVGVRFGEETNLTLCATRGKLFAKGDSVIVDFEAGPAFGRIEQSPMPVFKPCQKASARPIIRQADEEDSSDQEKKADNELAAKRFCK
ncbi:MAG: hypothetical protein V3W50_06415, partial [Thermoanaerobaculia bacterium]